MIMQILCITHLKNCFSFSEATLKSTSFTSNSSLQEKSELMQKKKSQKDNIIGDLIDILV